MYVFIPYLFVKYFVLNKFSTHSIGHHAPVDIRSIITYIIGLSPMNVRVDRQDSKGIPYPNTKPNAKV